MPFWGRICNFANKTFFQSRNYPKQQILKISGNNENLDSKRLQKNELDSKNNSKSFITYFQKLIQNVYF